jgi:hypothetical protein
LAVWPRFKKKGKKMNFSRPLKFSAEISVSSHFQPIGTMVPNEKQNVVPTDFFFVFFIISWYHIFFEKIFWYQLIFLNFGTTIVFPFGPMIQPYFGTLQIKSDGGIFSVKNQKSILLFKSQKETNCSTKIIVKG